jgi:hydrogenase expression/formation protein HypC
MCLAIPGEVLAIEERHGLRFGKVQFGGITRDVCLEYQPAARPGDYVLVHVGFAIATVDAAEVARTWDLLRELGEIEELGASGHGGDTKDLAGRGYVLATEETEER